MSVNEFIRHHKIEGADLDTNDIEDKLKAAIAHIEQVSSIRLGEGVYLYQVYCLPQNRQIQLPIYPVTAINSVKIETDVNESVTIDPDKYTLDNVTARNRIILLDNWDSELNTINYNTYVRTAVNFNCGYASNQIPDLAKQAINLLTSDFYTYRNESVAQRLSHIPMGLQRILVALSTGVYKGG